MNATSHLIHNTSVSNTKVLNDQILNWIMILSFQLIEGLPESTALSTDV